jgi:hypothetical protein
MFTGIVEELGQILEARPVASEWGDGKRLRIAAHLQETAVLDRHGRDDPVLGVHGVDAAVDQDQVGFTVRLVVAFAVIVIVIAPVVVVMRAGAADDACTCGCRRGLDKLAPGKAAAFRFLFFLRHLFLPIRIGERFDRPAS